MVIALLSEQQREWAGTPYRLGGQSRAGIDCSGFVQKTFLDRFDILLPRMTVQQANYGKLVSKQDIQTGDLVFLKPVEVQMAIMLVFMSKMICFACLN